MWAEGHVDSRFTKEPKIVFERKGFISLPSDSRFIEKEKKVTVSFSADLTNHVSVFLWFEFNQKKLLYAS